jgi:hypothetical protein
MELAAGNAKPLGEILVERECVAQENFAQAPETQRIDRLRRCVLLSDLSWDPLEWIGEPTDQI